MTLSDVAAMKAVVGIDPDEYSATTTTGAAIDTLGSHQALIVVSAGDIATSLDVKVTECETSGGSYTDVSGAAVTQILAAADNVVAVGRINLNGTERYLKIVGTSVGATCDYGVAVLLTPNYTGDGSTFDFEV
jgi:hypothetical protein